MNIWQKSVFNKIVCYKIKDLSEKYYCYNLRLVINLEKVLLTPLVH